MRGLGGALVLPLPSSLARLRAHLSSSGPARFEMLLSAVGLETIIVLDSGDENHVMWSLLVLLAAVGLTLMFKECVA